MGNQGSICQSDIDQLKKNQLTIQDLADQSTHILSASINFQHQSTFDLIDYRAGQFCQVFKVNESYKPLISKIIAYKNDHLFAAFHQLQVEYREQYLNNLVNINFDLLDALFDRNKKKNLNKKPKQQNNKVKLIKSIEINKSNEKYDFKQIGLNLLRKNKVCVVMMCGGESHRFESDDKFLQQLQYSETNLFSIMMQKLHRNYTHHYNRIINVPIIFACNENNLYIIEDYLKVKQWFFFNPKYIQFICQNNLPVINQRGKICLDFESNVITRPPGTATIFQQVSSEKIHKWLKQLNIKYIHFMGMQNFGENPADPYLIGLTHKLQRQIAAKVTNTIDKTLISQYPCYIETKNQIKLLDCNSYLQRSHFLNIFQLTIALNSIVISMNRLKNIAQIYHKKGKESKNYQIEQQRINYYNWSQNKPIANETCYTFYKDIRTLLNCSLKPIFMCVNSNQFIPLINRIQPFSLKNASQLYEKYCQREYLKRDTSSRGKVETLSTKSNSKI